MINYEQDFYGWTQEQAALLRAGQLNALDINNLIEEIETMGRSEKRALESRLTVLLAHLLKWQYQPERRGKRWTLTIKEQRMKYHRLIGDNPGLKPQLADILSNAYQLACVSASKETTFDDFLFPETCPWSLADVLRPDFYPD